MPITADQLADIANASLDALTNRPDIRYQNLQAMPMTQALEQNARTFPSGKSDVVVNVASGEGQIPLVGYTADESVAFSNPTGIRKAAYPWREMFVGLTITATELKTDGITLDDSASGGQRTSEKDGAERQRLAGLLKYKLDNLEQSRAAGFDAMIHGDGVATPRLCAGIRSLVTTTPAVGTTGGINRATDAWWRNRALTGADAIVSDTAGGGALLQSLSKEFRILKSYGNGKTKHRAFCGSDFLDAAERELRANGSYSVDGFNKSIDLAIRKLNYHGTELVWDPTLDKIGFSKRMYLLDLNAIYLTYMAGERKKKANPVRPADKFVFMTGYSDTAAIVAEQLNTSGVYDIA